MLQVSPTIGAKRNSRTLLSSQSQQTDFEILSVGIAVNLDCFIEVGSFSKDATPVCSQTFPVIENTYLRMPENVDAFVTPEPPNTGWSGLRFAEAPSEMNQRRDLIC